MAGQVVGRLTVHWSNWRGWLTGHRCHWRGQLTGRGRNGRGRLAGAGVVGFTGVRCIRGVSSLESAVASCGGWFGIGRIGMGKGLAFGGMHHVGWGSALGRSAAGTTWQVGQ